MDRIEYSDKVRKELFRNMELSESQKDPVSLIGFTQYIWPTISLIIGIFVCNEGLTAVDMIAFCFIWVAITIYSFSQMSLTKSLKDLKQTN